jgi:5-methylcytosine-specific restriction protein B
MTKTLGDDDLQEIFRGQFRAYREEPWAVDWRASYVSHAERVRSANRATWLDPAFQRMLWDENPVSNIGPGTSVTVTSAYGDETLAARIFDIREAFGGDDLPARGKALQDAFDEILARVYPTHAKRRPKARLVRLLALMFPHDMTCLMDAARVWGVHRLIGAPLLLGDFVAQHAALRQRIRSAVGEPENLAAEVDQSVFTWFLWNTMVKRPDEGAVTIEKGPKEANDVPPLSLLPANAQRRSLTCVRDNISLLVAVVREAEQGISRDDLISVILTEATQLNASSAGNIISQALGGLGLIHLDNGAYRPTERGLELLTAADPAQVLRAPLIGRVFGMGHLLLMLAASPGGVGQTDAARRLQALVPSWTTTQPGSYIVAWAKLTGLARSETVGGLARLMLTDEGEDYVSALPDDFEERWTIQPSSDGADQLTDGKVIAEPSRAAGESYGIDAIVADGCFLPRSTISDALALLTRKKNLVLQGPPGTGKTWLAKRLGYALIGAKDPSRLMAVQFQPSLSYEDFVRGWRPNGTGGLQLADGAFLEAVAVANAEPGRPFVLVIEEINRGNPAQILGELLTLLETDKRVEAEALRLAYPRTVDERVHVPPNLHVVGTMNLADRSLALVDLALRRRFAFVTLAPALGEPWRDWCRMRGGPDELIDAIERGMHALNAEIEADRALGPQFRIGHSFVTPPDALTGATAERWQEWFASVVETEIAPLLAEYWYDKPERAADLAKALGITS